MINKNIKIETDTENLSNLKGAAKTKKSLWGLLPDDVIKSLRVKYWQNSKNLKELLKNNIPLPLLIPLKPPKGNQAIQNIEHLQKFVSSWRQFSSITVIDNQLTNYDSKVYKPNDCGLIIRWENKNFRSLNNQDIPTHLEILDINFLVKLLGLNEQQQLHTWQLKIKYIVDSITSIDAGDSIDSVDTLNLVDSGDSIDLNSSNLVNLVDSVGSVDPVNSVVDISDICSNNDYINTKNLFNTLVDNLEIIDKFEQNDLDLLVKLIPQIHKNMGHGCYLRALPVIFVDTKFIENNLRIIEAIATVTIDENIKEMGLINWLGCIEKPKTWLLVKPLCTATSNRLSGLPLLRISSDTLHNFPLPANNILVIENEQSCLALQNIADTIAVSGGGKNVSWMSANWLKHKNVAYWGDIDSEGLNILSDARSKLSDITPLMMDETTVIAFQERMVDEPDSIFKEPVALTETELELFKNLRASYYANKRLEQERLPLEYVMRNINQWVK